MLPPYAFMVSTGTVYIISSMHADPVMVPIIFQFIYIRKLAFMGINKNTHYSANVFKHYQNEAPGEQVLHAVM